MTYARKSALGESPRTGTVMVRRARSLALACLAGAALAGAVPAMAQVIEPQPVAPVPMDPGTPTTRVYTSPRGPAMAVPPPAPIEARPPLPYGVPQPVPLTVTGLRANSKVYDGTTIATLSGKPVLLGDIDDADRRGLSLSGVPTARFAKAHAGTNIAVIVTGYDLVGDSGRHYTLSRVVLRADITPAPLTTTPAIAANNKRFDGTLNATLTFGRVGVIGVFGNDEVAFSPANYSAHFANIGPSNPAGAPIPVIVTRLSLTGKQSANYVLVPPTGLFATIE